MTSKIVAYVCAFHDKDAVSVQLLTKAESIALWIIENYGHFKLHTSYTNDGSYKGDFRLEGDAIPDDTAIFFHCKLDEPETFAKLDEELDGWMPEGAKDWKTVLYPVYESGQKDGEVLTLKLSSHLRLVK